MADLRLSSSDKESLKANTFNILNGLAIDNKLLATYRQSLFFIALVQYLHVSDTGVYCFEGKAEVSNIIALEKWCNNDRMRDYIKEVVELRNRLCVAWCLRDTWKGMFDLWERQELVELCEKIGVKTDLLYDMPFQPIFDAIEENPFLSTSDKMSE